jgi:hypothetical protein
MQAARKLLGALAPIKNRTPAIWSVAVSASAGTLKFCHLCRHAGVTPLGHLFLEKPA